MLLFQQQKNFSTSKEFLNTKKITPKIRFLQKITAEILILLFFGQKVTVSKKFLFMF